MGRQMRFILFTKTNWKEPPRLRHQLARLLADAGHEVVFFERPVFPWQSISQSDSNHSRIHLYRYWQGLHHKLRFLPWLHYANAVVEKAGIARFTNDLRVNDKDVIVNFNYDYFFLRDLFPKQRVITIINDLFWSRAIGGYERPLKWALEITCRSSNIVLAVSPPLQRSVSRYCSAQIFSSWSDDSYKAPIYNPSRNILLYWGSIENYLDFTYIESLAKYFDLQKLDFKIHFVGPLGVGTKTVSRLNKYKSIEIYDPTYLDDLPLDKILVGFIPYRTGISGVDACVLPNKSLRLMSRGLPLAITGMPEFVMRPFVFRLPIDPVDTVSSLLVIRGKFYDLQNQIRSFVSENSGPDRLLEFMTFTKNDGYCE